MLLMVAAGSCYRVVQADPHQTCLSHSHSVHAKPRIQAHLLHQCIHSRTHIRTLSGPLHTHTHTCSQSHSHTPFLSTTLSPPFQTHKHTHTYPSHPLPRQAFDESPEEDELEEPLRLDILANDVTYRRIRGALTTLKSRRVAHAATMVNVLFGVQAPRRVTPQRIRPFSSTLNPSQLSAVEYVEEKEQRRDEMGGDEKRHEEMRRVY